MKKVLKHLSEIDSRLKLTISSEPQYNASITMDGELTILVVKDSYEELKKELLSRSMLIFITKELNEVHVKHAIKETRIQENRTKLENTIATPYICGDDEKEVIDLEKLMEYLINNDGIRKNLKIE